MPRAALPAIALAALIAAAVTTGLMPSAPADAQAQSAPAQGAAAQALADPAHGGAPHWRPMFDPSRHIEGRIAFLKAELKITDAQQAQWDKLASVMRNNALALSQAMQTMRGDEGAPKSAADRLEARARLTALRAGQMQMLADAFRPLYDGMSDEQKQDADELWHAHFHHGH